MVYQPTLVHTGNGVGNLGRHFCSIVRPLPVTLALPPGDWAGDRPCAARSPVKGTTRRSCFDVIIPMGPSPGPNPHEAIAAEDVASCNALKGSSPWRALRHSKNPPDLELPKAIDSRRTCGAEARQSPRRSCAFLRRPGNRFAAGILFRLQEYVIR